MNRQQESSNTAHSLYAFYETLPDAVQREFLSELVQKKRQELEDLYFYLDCKQAKDENDFLDDNELEQASGILKATVGVSLAEMDAAIKVAAVNYDCSQSP